MSSLGVQPGLGASRRVIHQLMGNFKLRIWLGLHFWTGMLFQDQQNMLSNSANSGCANHSKPLNQSVLNVLERFTLLFP